MLYSKMEILTLLAITLVPSRALVWLVYHLIGIKLVVKKIAPPWRLFFESLWAINSMDMDVQLSCYHKAVKRLHCLYNSDQAFFKIKKLAATWDPGNRSKCLVPKHSLRIRIATSFSSTFTYGRNKIYWLIFTWDHLESLIPQMQFLDSQKKLCVKQFL